MKPCVMALAIVLLSHISAIAQQEVELKYDRIQLAEGFRNELLCGTRAP